MHSKSTFVSLLLVSVMATSPLHAHQAKKPPEKEAQTSSGGKLALFLGSLVLAVGAYFTYNDYHERRNESAPDEPKRPSPKRHGHKRSTVSMSVSSSSDSTLLPVHRDPPVLPLRPILKQVARAVMVDQQPADRTVISQLDRGLEVEITRSSRIVELLAADSRTILWEKITSLAVLEEIILFLKSGDCAKHEEAQRVIRKLEERGFKALPNLDSPC